MTYIQVLLKNTAPSAYLSIFFILVNTQGVVQDLLVSSSTFEEAYVPLQRVNVEVEEDSGKLSVKPL